MPQHMIAGPGPDLDDDVKGSVLGGNEMRDPPGGKADEDENKFARHLIPVRNSRAAEKHRRAGDDFIR
jgi:hypothetical protein